MRVPAADLHQMAGLLGGRAAEMLVFAELSTGAADDLDKATDIARNMVMRYGMDEALGQVVYAEQRPLFLGELILPRPESRSYSERTAWAIDEAVRRLVDDGFTRATAILARNRAMLDETARRLLEKETLTTAELPTPLAGAIGSDAVDQDQCADAPTARK